MKLAQAKTLLAALAATGALVTATSVQAAIINLTDLSTGSAFDPEVSKSGITVTGASTAGAVPQNLVDGDTTDNFPNGVWFDGNDPTSTTLTFDLGGTFTISSVTIDFAWNDRDDMVYNFIANGSTQGSFQVDDGGGDNGGFLGENSTTFLFDSVFTTDTIEFFLDDIANGIGGHSNESSPSLAEITFHGVVPEPGSLALMGLGGLLIARRRRG